MYRTFLNVQFLNLMAILQARGGKVNVRVGGNSQDTATLVSSLPDGRAMSKQKVNDTDTVSRSVFSVIVYILSGAQSQTPYLTITPELIYMLSNVSTLVGTKWYLGTHFALPLPARRQQHQQVFL